MHITGLMISSVPALVCYGYTLLYLVFHFYIAFLDIVSEASYQNAFNFLAAFVFKERLLWV